MGPSIDATEVPRLLKFHAPEIVFGPGSLAEAGFAAERLGARRPFVVTDPGLLATGWVDELLDHLREAGLVPTLWHGVTPNPKDHEILAGFQKYAESGCDVIIAIGGGSCIDAGKGVAVLSGNGGSILDYAGVDQFANPIPPLLMIPSTAGTGADVSRFWVVTDTAQSIKVTLIGRSLVPDISITDPRLLVTMPTWLAAATGLDALTHGIEAFVSLGHNPLTDGHALSAVRLVSGNLCHSLSRPGAPEILEGMAQASLEAGLAFTNAILGATHAMSHQVGGLLDAPHGVVNGVLLPHVIRCNAAAVPERFIPLALAAGLKVEGMPGREAAEMLADHLRSLADEVGVPRGLRHLGVSEENIGHLAKSNLGDACLSTNPRSADRRDVEGALPGRAVITEPKPETSSAVGRSAAPDLAALTGVRSSKQSYYREYRRSNERMQRAVRAMDSISRAVVRTVEGPRGLIEDVVRAAGEHLQSQWLLIGLADGWLAAARPRYLALGPGGQLIDDDHLLPAEVRRELGAVRAGATARQLVDQGGWVRVPMTLDGDVVGGLVGLHGLESDPEAADLSVLCILANQAAVSMHTSQQYQASLALRRRGQQLHDEATQQAYGLAQRDAELLQAEKRLVVARQRELLDAERHRIARELHDSVTQYVLSAGMAVDLSRRDIADMETPDQDVVDRLDDAKELTRRAVEQLRSAIYALHHGGGEGEDVAGLPELLSEVAIQHQQHLAVSLRVEGQPFPMGAIAEHSLARVAGEALFNVSAHAAATRAIVRLCYTDSQVRLWVSDNGTSDPAQLRRMLRLRTACDVDGRHNGLVNMASRAAELGGTFALRRARLGGLRIEVRVPWPLTVDLAAS